MSIEDYVLIDNLTGVVLGSDTSAIVPVVYGEAAYDVYYDIDSAIEYGLVQGLLLLPPDGGGTPVTDEYPRDYNVIDTANGYVGKMEDVRAVPVADAGDTDEITADSSAALQLAREKGQVPDAPKEIADIEGLPYIPIG